MKPKITIAIGSRNGSKYLKEIIPAWLNQDYENFSILVADDASNDDTYDYVSKLKDKVIYKKVEQHKGYGGIKNLSVDNSDSEYILLIDNDILPKSNSYLSNLYEAYLTLDKVSFLGVSMYDKDSKDTKYYGIFYSFYGINTNKASIKNEELVKFDGPYQVPSYHGGGVFFMKSIWNSLGGYDTMQKFMLDDTDLSARAWLNGYKVYLYNKELLEHIGISNHNDKKYFAWKFQYYFSGVVTLMLKNLKFVNLYRACFAVFISPILYLILAYKKRNIFLLLAYLKSVKLLILNFPDILKSRSKIQANRKVRDDQFLKLIQPFR